MSAKELDALILESAREHGVIVVAGLISGTYEALIDFAKNVSSDIARKRREASLRISAERNYEQ